MCQTAVLGRTPASSDSAPVLEGLAVKRRDGRELPPRRGAGAQSLGGEGPKAGRRPGARAEAQLLGVPGTRGGGDRHVGQMLCLSRGAFDRAVDGVSVYVT